MKAFIEKNFDKSNVYEQIYLPKEDSGLSEILWKKMENTGKFAKPTFFTVGSVNKRHRKSTVSDQATESEEMPFTTTKISIAGNYISPKLKKKHQLVSAQCHAP